MDEFGSLAKDFGFRPQGKSAPMKSSGGDRRTSPLTTDGSDMFHDVFGGPPKYTNSNSKSASSMSDFDYDSIFKANNNNNEAKTTPMASNSPVYDKPLYDDDIFDNLPGVNSKSDNVFASMANYPPKQSQQSDQSDQFEDLFGDFGRTEKTEPNRHRSDKSSEGFDDLIPGFGRSSPASNSRWNSDPSPTSTSNTKEKSNEVNDPFASSQGFFTDPLEQFSNIGNSNSTKSGVTSSGDVFADMDPLNNFNKSPPAYSKESEAHNKKKGPSQTHSEEGSSVGSARSSVSREPFDEYSFGFSESQTQKMPFDHFQESHQTSHTGTSSNVYTSPKLEEHVLHEDDIWLTVSEIPLFTPITQAPPPSRPPPPIPARASTTRTFDNDFSSSSSTKYANATRSKEPMQVTTDEDTTQERLEREDEEKIREIVKEKARQAVERANREARERAANEARLKAERAAVQRAQTEARERAAVEARERAERAAAEKAAAERAAAEKAAAERAAAEKAAADRAAAEKAAAEAKEKETREKEKAAVVKAQAEARRRAERAAVERVTAEARERAANEARERAAAATKVNQQRNDDDLDSFFSMGSQPNTVPKSRASSNDSATDPLSQDRRGTHRASSSAIPSNVKKTSTVNFVDDLSSIFGAGMPASEFQDVEGETEERRRARMERQQRTQERAAKALAEKNQRDLQVQKEQEERHRISATLDVEIKRWASGKEGNLRAMLSTLQYVLWPGCGWQPVALTDLITGASVKKVYRKATLCIHPDKVQQKGANLQQKYVAEKVFDLLKEAWNKFNSEELF